MIYQKFIVLKKLFKTQSKRKYFKIIKIFFLPLNKYLYQTSFNFKIFLDFTKDVDWRFYLNEFEKENLFLFEKVISEDSVILDIGANIGIYSILAGLKSGKRGKVYSFEPADWAYERLNLNITYNKLTNVNTVKLGVSNINGLFNLNICEDDAYNSLGTAPMRDIISTKVIPVVSIDSFCSENKIEKIDVIKVDTEGADYLVLLGAENILKEAHSPIIFCEFNLSITEGFKYTLENFENYLSKLNYNLYQFNGTQLTKYNPELSKGYEVICIKNDHFKKYPFLDSFL